MKNDESMKNENDYRTGWTKYTRGARQQKVVELSKSGNSNGIEAGVLHPACYMRGERGRDNEEGGGKERRGG